MTDQERMLDRTAMNLGEHFDAVQILVTWMDGGTTKTCSRGAGNWHSRQNMARDFVTRETQQDQAVAIAEELRKN